MTFAGTAALGAVAGFTIFLGLPVARIGRPSAAVSSLLTGGSVGILLFLLYDVLSKANATVEDRLSSSHLTGSLYGLVLAGGIATGLLGLVWFERVALRRPRSLQSGPPASTVPPRRSGPGAMAADTLVPPRAAHRIGIALDPAQRIALGIAVGIGLHNFSEGLAIGQSAATGAYSLFGVLVIGFGLHNITEGFGITGPLINHQPSWRFLFGLGSVGGGPTLLGTVIGYKASSPILSVLFLALAAGAILYVVGELQHVGRRMGHHDMATVGLLIGLLAGYGTDKLLFVAGG